MKNTVLHNTNIEAPKNGRYVLVFTKNMNNIFLATYIRKTGQKRLKGWHGFSISIEKENEERFGFYYANLEEFPYWLEIEEALQYFSLIKSYLQKNNTQKSLDI